MIIAQPRYFRPCDVLSIIIHAANTWRASNPRPNHERVAQLSPDRFPRERERGGGGGVSCMANE